MHPECHFVMLIRGLKKRNIIYCEPSSFIRCRRWKEFHYPRRFEKPHKHLPSPKALSLREVWLRNKPGWSPPATHETRPRGGPPRTRQEVVPRAVTVLKKKKEFNKMFCQRYPYLLCLVFSGVDRGAGAQQLLHAVVMSDSEYMKIHIFELRKKQ